MSRQVDLLALTWFWTSTRSPRAAEPLVKILEDVLPNAHPTRFGPGDPPREKVERDLKPFLDAWRTEAGKEYGWLLSWEGREDAYT
jgi:hypothetical protein